MQKLHTCSSLDSKFNHNLWFDIIDFRHVNEQKGFECRMGPNVRESLVIFHTQGEPSAIYPNIQRSLNSDNASGSNFLYSASAAPPILALSCKQFQKLCKLIYPKKESENDQIVELYTGYIITADLHIHTNMDECVYVYIYEWL